MSAANKLLSVLALFTFERPEWTVEQASEDLHLGLSTTYRYFKSLADAGLIVAYSPGRYVLGPSIIQLDRQVRLLDPLISVSKPCMQTLLRDVGVPCVALLCRLFRRSVMCIHQEASTSESFAVSYERGKLLPLHRGAASRIVLAHMGARFVRAYREKNADELAAVGLGSDWPTVKRNLRLLRNAGIVVAHAEFDPGVIGMGAPLFDAQGSVIGSLGLVLPDLHIQDSVVASAAEALRRKAAEITDSMAKAGTCSPAIAP